MPQRHSFFYLNLVRLQKFLETHEEITLGGIQNFLGQPGQIFFLLVLSTPFLQPIPLPGLSVVLGLFIMFYVPSIYGRTQFKTPVFFSEKKISSAKMIQILKGIEKIWSRFELVTKARFFTLHSSKIFILNNFLLIELNAFLLALPLPIPFTNSLPALGIFLNCLGQLEEDGLLIFLSYIFTGVTLFYFTLLALSAQQIWSFWV